MREEARRLLDEAVAAHGVAATARRLGVARASLSLLYHDKYPGSTARMEERILGRTARTGAYFLRSEANTGPLAPAYNRAEKCVTDRNTGKTCPLEAAHA